MIAQNVILQMIYDVFTFYSHYIDYMLFCSERYINAVFMTEQAMLLTKITIQNEMFKDAFQENKS